MYKRGLYHDWVPKPLQLLMIILCLLPFLVVSGVYSNNIGDMVGGTGMLSEVFSLASYAGFIGMCVALPMLMRTKQYFKTKEMAVGSLLLLALLSWVSYHTDNPYLIVFSAFLIGAFKMLGMMEYVLPVYFIITPTLDRTKFYPIFYPLTIVIAQITGYYFAILAYNLNWTQAHLFITIYMLVCAILSIVLMHDSYGSKKVPFYQFDWTGMILFTAMLLLLSYVLVYTKYHGWLVSPEIYWGFAAFCLMLVVFVATQRKLKRPYLLLSVLKYKNVYSSLIMISFIGIYQGTGSMQNMFMLGVLKYSSQTVALINMAMIPGIIAGGIFSYFWFKRNWNLKGMVLFGFGAYLWAQLIIYFLFAPEVQIGYFFFPTFLKGFALCLLYISTAAYCSDKLKMHEQLSAFTLLILFRSFIGTAVFGSILTWAMYKLQLQNASDLAAHIDASESFAMLRGGGMGLYGTIQLQSIMLAAKQLFGFTIVAGIVVMIYVALHRFKPIHHRRKILMNKLSKGHSTKGYRLYGTPKEEEVAIEEAAAIIV